MSSSSSAADIELLKAHAVPLNGGRTDFEPLLKMIKTRDAEFVLLGEASHGTHDFYRVRAEITKRLSGCPFDTESDCRHLTLACLLNSQRTWFHRRLRGSGLARCHES
jgi:hypothetical protein